MKFSMLTFLFLFLMKRHRILSCVLRVFLFELKERFSVRCANTLEVNNFTLHKGKRDLRHAARKVYT